MKHGCYFLLMKSVFVAGSAGSAQGRAATAATATAATTKEADKRKQNMVIAW